MYCRVFHENNGKKWNGSSDMMAEDIENDEENKEGNTSKNRFDRRRERKLLLKLWYPNFPLQEKPGSNQEAG